MFSPEDHAVFVSPLQPLSSLARSDKSDGRVKISENLISTKQENRWTGWRRKSLFLGEVQQGNLGAYQRAGENSPSLEMPPFLGNPQPEPASCWALQSNPVNLKGLPPCTCCPNQNPSSVQQNFAFYF